MEEREFQFHIHTPSTAGLILLITLYRTQNTHILRYKKKKKKSWNMKKEDVQNIT
jgi:hypothetical protein